MAGTGFAHRSRMMVAAASLTVGGLLLAGCTASHRETESQRAADSTWTVCGTPLITSVSAPSVLDVTGLSGPSTIRNVTVGGIALLLTDDCSHGASVTFAPAAAAAIQRSAKTADGRLAAVALMPNATEFTITVHQGGASVRTIRVALSGDLADLRRAAALPST